MIVVNGDIYLEQEHKELLKTEPGYVKKRYFAVAKALARPPFKISYKKATEQIDRSLRQFYRILKRYREEGIFGLRLRSTRPKGCPNITPEAEKNQLLAVRNATGFGPNDLAALINESNRRRGKGKAVWPSTVYNVLVRGGEIERERRIQPYFYT